MMKKARTDPPKLDPIFGIMEILVSPIGSKKLLAYADSTTQDAPAHGDLAQDIDSGDVNDPNPGTDWPPVTGYDN